MKINKIVINECIEICKKMNFKINIENFDISYFKDFVNWDYISINFKLSEEFLECFKDFVNWDKISVHQILSENILEKFQNYINWDYVSAFQSLSEEFIEIHINQVNWEYISEFQDLSDDFIIKHDDKINFHSISRIKELSENMLNKYKHKIDSFDMEFGQNLSEKFITDNKFLFNWIIICDYQTLSEPFIEKNKDIVNWNIISLNQKLSEPFIEKNINLVDLNSLVNYQYLSKDFLKRHNLQISDYCWLYKSDEFKRKYIEKYTRFEIEKDEKGEYIYAYKIIKFNNTSFFNCKYTYKENCIYTSNCDCNIDVPASFGLHATNRKDALNYAENDTSILKYKLMKVKIYIKDIGAVIIGEYENHELIRCFKYEVLKISDIIYNRNEF